MPKRLSWVLLLLTAFSTGAAAASELPHIVRRDGHAALFVDGAPFTILAAQMHNSSGWPARMPAVWKSVLALHANTLEAPIYWQQFEPASGRYDMSSVDMLIDQSRRHGVRLILLWFGTWKNGQMQYVPDWIKTDRQHYPHVQDAHGDRVDDLSTMSGAILDADRNAFVALMRHVRQRDADIHTVIMVQVENEPGLIGTVRDHDALSNTRFDQAVPDDVPAGAGAPGGTWRQRFANQADEMFSAYTISKYVDAVAAAGKAADPLPIYVNVWMRYKGFTRPGFDYPSGGATWNVLALWKRATPHVDLIGTDVYTDDFNEYTRATAPYRRADNPPWISECHYATPTALYLFDSLGRGGIGFSVFGIDNDAVQSNEPSTVAAHAANFALLDEIDRQVAWAAWAGQLRSVVEQPGQSQVALPLSGDVVARVSFGTMQFDGSTAALGPDPDHDGRIMIAREDDRHFLILGFDSRVEIAPPEHGAGQVLRVEEGSFRSGSWQTSSIWNGDETDHGLVFDHAGHIVRVTLQ